MQAIWGHIWKYTVGKSRTNAASVTIHHPGQPIWEHIWKHTVEKSQTNATCVTLRLCVQTIWQSIWKCTVENRTHATNAIHMMNTHRKNCECCPVSQLTEYFPVSFAFHKANRSKKDIVVDFFLSGQTRELGFHETNAFLKVFCCLYISVPKGKNGIRDMKGAWKPIYICMGSIMQFLTLWLNCIINSDASLLQELLVIAWQNSCHWKVWDAWVLLYPMRKVMAWHKVILHGFCHEVWVLPCCMT